MMLPCMLLACSLMAPPAPAGQAAPPAPQQAPVIVLENDDGVLDKALESRTPAGGLAVRVAAVNLPGQGADAGRILVAAEIDARREATALTSVAYALYDSKGRPAARALRRAELRRRPSGALAFLDVAAVKPGAYRLKVAALSDGRVGTAETPVTVRVQAAGPVGLGDLVVGSVPGGDIESSLVAAGPVRGDRVVISLPVAASPALPADVAIRMEVAKDAAGASMVAAPATVLPGDGQTRVAQAVFDARVLASGDYAGRAVVSIGGREVGRVVGTFSLDRSAVAAGAAPGGAAPVARTSAVAAFKPGDVLDPAVLAPFLDDLAARGPAVAGPAIAQAKAGRLAEAARTAASAKPDDPARPFLRGLSLYSQGQWQAASDAFRETVRAAPDFLVGAFYIGACYAAGGRDQQAINAWQTSLVGLDQYPVVYRLLGEAMSRLGQADRAVDVLGEAAGKWPDDRGLRLRLARAGVEARRFDLAADLADAEIARGDPDPALLLAGMQAIFERAMGSEGPAPEDALARMKRYREAYAAAGGSELALADGWLAALEKKSGP